MRFFARGVFLVDERGRPLPDEPPAIAFVSRLDDPETFCRGRQVLGNPCTLDEARYALEQTERGMQASLEAICCMANSAGRVAEIFEVDPRTIVPLPR